MFRLLSILLAVVSGATCLPRASRAAESPDAAAIRDDATWVRARGAMEEVVRRLPKETSPPPDVERLSAQHGRAKALLESIAEAASRGERVATRARAFARLTKEMPADEASILSRFEDIRRHLIANGLTDKVTRLDALVDDFKQNVRSLRSAAGRIRRKAQDGENVADDVADALQRVRPDAGLRYGAITREREGDRTF
jgi:hypothetical protein